MGLPELAPPEGGNLCIYLYTRDNPANADAPANLGQAYLQKAGSIQDIREQGILGMKADQVFDIALTGMIMCFKAFGRERWVIC